MARRLFWEQENEGSNPSIPTLRLQATLGTRWDMRGQRLGLNLFGGPRASHGAWSRVKVGTR